MFSRLILAAALLGLANCLQCKYCDNAVPNKKCSEGFSEDKVCSAQTGEASCVSKWANNPKDIVSADCSSEPAAGPATISVACGNQMCANFGRGDIRCFCGNTNCNHPFTFPAACDPQAEPEPEAEPGNGVKGKVGAVFSVFMATIFAAIV